MQTLSLLFIVLIELSINNYKPTIEKTWFNKEQTAKIQISKGADGLYTGKIIWLKYPNWYNGKPQLDRENPEPQKRNMPLLGMTVLSNLKMVSATEFVEGTIYDPNSGRTLCGKAIIKDNDLILNGSLCSVSWLSGEIVWTAAE